MFLFCSRPRSEGWPHHRRTFSIYLCPLSFWLTFHGESCPRLDVVHPGRVWSSSPSCTWHCSLHYLFLQATLLFPHGVTTVCKLACFDSVHLHHTWVFLNDFIISFLDDFFIAPVTAQDRCIWYRIRVIYFLFSLLTTREQSNFSAQTSGNSKAKSADL